LKNPNIYSAYTKNFQQNFDEIYFPNREIIEVENGKHIDIPKALKENIIKVRGNNKCGMLFVHLLNKCINYGNYCNKYYATKVAEKLKDKYLQNFEIIVEESFF